MERLEFEVVHLDAWLSGSYRELSRQFFGASQVYRKSHRKVCVENGHNTGKSGEIKVQSIELFMA